MTPLRALIAAHRPWFALLLALTLAARLLVPAGFMPSGTGAALQLCSGTMAAMPGMHGGGEQHGKPDEQCPFAGLALAAIGSADPVLLAAALLFAFILAARAVMRAVPRPAHRLRPPLRAPPPIA